MKLNKKGFTLVELLIAMAIIAVLIAIAAYGIQILQRNARNTRRRKIVQDIQLAVSDVQANYFEYPGTGVTSTDGIGKSGTHVVTINTPTNPAGGNEQTYTISGFNSSTVSAGNCPTTSPETSQSNVALWWNGTTLTLGVKLEGTNACFNVNV